ncbi:TlyA family RNA methyltransferase [Nitratidesulfovibrio liaohensis]
MSRPVDAHKKVAATLPENAGSTASGQDVSGSGVSGSHMSGHGASAEAVVPRIRPAKPAKKERADQLVFEAGLAESREQAKRLIMAGQVVVLPEGDGDEDGADVPDLAKTPERAVKVDKPGHKYPVTTRFELFGRERFVSRGAYKLLTAIEYFGLDVTGFVCLDAGASTGGFTDCLLQHGAARVYSVDVGHNQLHERLRADARVVSHEHTNLRTAPPELIPEPVDLVVADVSFISLTLVLAPCLQWLKPGGRVVALVKPQFEVGPGQTEKGVVRDPALRQAAVDKVVAYCRDALGLDLEGVVPSAITGPKGNQEYLAAFRRR